MNASFLQDVVSAGLPTLASIADNGECQFLSLDTENSTDEQGFPAPAYTERTAGFLSCSWSRIKTEDLQGGNERIVGSKPQPFERYQITISRVIDTTEVEVASSDRIRLREAPCASDDFKTLEIVSITNQTNTAWHIEAAEVE